MKTELEIVTEELYKVFEKYPFKSNIDGCPCCVSNSDKSNLHSKPLRELDNDDISRYAFKALTTWGDLNDFKHYLPRIFELLSKRELIVDVFVIIGKLEYGNWKKWEEQEIEIIKKFLKSWWKYDINTNDYFDEEILIEINRITEDLSSMLSDWNLNIETQGFKNYVDFIENHYYELKVKNNTFKKLSDLELKTLINWIESNSVKLEDAFFKFESIDKEFSNRISDTMYMIERV